MREVVMDLKDISESREVMQAKPYPVVVYFTYILMGILSVALLWAYFGEIDIVVKGAGTVRPEANTSIVTNKVTGKVVDVAITEGAKVKVGDILYKIEHDALAESLGVFKADIAVKEQEINNLKKYKESILNGTNLFDANKPEENPYYYKYQALAEQKGISQGLIEGLNNEIAGLRALETAIESSAPSLDVHGEYAIKYQAYQLKVSELQSKIEESNRQHKIKQELFESGSIPSQEVEDAKQAAEKTELDLKQYKSTTLLEIASTITQKKQEESKLSALKGKGGKLLPVETQGIVEADERLVALNESLGSFIDQFEKIKYEIDKCIVKAETDGTVHLKTQVTKGDFINSGTVIATVIPSSESQFKVLIVMSQSEIAHFKIGDRIKYKFQALPYQEYGTLEGKVTKISADTNVDEKQGAVYYTIEAGVENKPLYSYKGKKAELKVGMTCEAQVVTKSKRILSLLFEKLGLWD